LVLGDSDTLAPAPALGGFFLVMRFADAHEG
jgi:hypothetical protein